MKRRKPDLLLVLVLLVGIGVIATGFWQGGIAESQARVSTAKPLIR